MRKKSAQQKLPRLNTCQECILSKILYGDLIFRAKMANANRFLTSDCRVKNEKIFKMRLNDTFLPAIIPFGRKGKCMSYPVAAYTVSGLTSVPSQNRTVSDVISVTSGLMTTFPLVINGPSSSDSMTGRYSGWPPDHHRHEKD